MVFEAREKKFGSLNAKVLVLNQSYEPLTLCTVKKAIILLLLGKAEVVIKDSRKQVKSVSRALDYPSVIRLKRYIQMPYKKVVLTRKNVLRRDGYRCGYCGRGDLPLTVDHIVPKAKNGTDSWENLVCACTSCNNRKGDRTPAEANMKLLIRPTVPSHILFIKNSMGRIEDTWKPYLYLS